MAHFPQLSKTRALRVRVPSNESVKFNLGDKQVSATLQKLSMTGGLAEFPAQLGEVALAEVVLTTISGPIKALVEFLQSPVQGSASRPFRFIALDEGDYQRLAITLQSMRRQGLAE
jgi:hypothetical protein